MIIEHLAIWTNDLENLKDFYVKYFNAKANQKYLNEKNNFQSYFLSFKSGPRLELMQMPGIPNSENNAHQQSQGLIHMAFSVGSKQEVGTLTNQMRNDGFEVLGEPRTTGDGYYESVVLDPDQNRIEITI